MIEIHRGKNGITIQGHAGYAEFGKDIVCAAVSTLTQVFLASVEALTTDNLTYDIAAGNTVIRYGDLSEQSNTLLDSFFVGVSMIADEYPEYVRLTEH